MKSTVNQSIYSFILTIIVIGVLAVGMICTYGTDKFIILTVLVAVMLAFCMCYAPVSISADKNTVSINSPFKVHSIPMRRIVSVERFYPTMGSRRVCGSGGFMGYWGIFKEGDVGRYMAYYGKASDCFIIRLDNGDKYVLGCKSPNKMVEYISSRINHG